jgi:hypothetical protein
MCESELTSSQHDPFAGSYPQSDEHLGFIKDGKYVDQLSNYHILQDSHSYN